MLASITKFLIALAVVLIPTAARAQVNPFTSGAGAPSGSCTASQVYLDTTGHNLYICSNGSWTNVGQGNLSGGSVSLPTTLSAPGVFTNTQNNTNFLVNINGCDLTNTVGSGAITDAISACMSTPSSGTLTVVQNAIGGYAYSNATTAIANGVFGKSICNVSGFAECEGVVGGAAANFANNIAVAVEANPITNVSNPSQSYGFYAAPGGTAQPGTDNLVGFFAQKPGTLDAGTTHFTTGFECAVGATGGSGSIPCFKALPFATGNSRASQTIEFDATNNAGATVTGAINENPIGASGFLSMNEATENAGIMSEGTQSVSGCSLTAAVGGAWSGKFASGTTGTCTVTITPGFTAINGFLCVGMDTTTVADSPVKQSAFTTTTCTLSGTTASGDVITWVAIAF